MTWEQTMKSVQTLHVELPGGVKGKERPKWNAAQHHAYTPKGTRMAEKAIKTAWMKVHGTRGRYWLGAVNVTIQYKREVAKREPKKNTGKLQLMKPDVDNVAKLVLDSLTGTAWADDEQVNELHVIREPQGEPGSGAWMFLRVEYIDEREVIVPRENRRKA